MKKKYIFETHLHTSEGSACGFASGAEMVKAYKAGGYSGMVVTDHFFNGNSAIPRDLPWEERVRRFCLGYEHALEEAGNDGFQVFFGWEYSYWGTDFLTYGLDKAFLLEHPDILTWNLEQYFNTIHSNGGFIVHAHPFREADYISKIRLFPEHVDAIEVVNAAHVNPEFDRNALAFAEKHSLYQTSGSDAHHAIFLRGGGMAFNSPMNSIQDLIEGIKRPACYQLLKPGMKDVSTF
jgi:hypothetical protein